MRLDGSLGVRPHPSPVSRWAPGHGEPASAVRRLSPRAPEGVPGMNYVELHIGDYEKATAHLTGIEDGISGRLLRRYYDAEGPLVADLKALQRLVRARTRDERGAVENILEEFFYLADDGWHHTRCDEEIDRYQAKRSGRAHSKLQSLMRTSSAGFCLTKKIRHT